MFCLPIPLRCGQGKMRKHQYARPELEWLGEEDARVRCLFDTLLGDSKIGLIKIRVEKISTDFPTLSMDESYVLTIKDQIELFAPSTWGALRGLATLYQIEQHRDLGCELLIEDRPRFPWRGLLIDVARHFIPLNFLYEIVDGLAVLKMNVLHLHLSDDQDFRFESKKFPRLASREYYSQRELMDFVSYASDRGVRVIPEIDVPGHVTSWLVSYPKWGLRKVRPTKRFGVHEACLDPTNDAMYGELNLLFSEVVSIFQDEYVHIGGDEVNPDWWCNDANTQMYMRDHGFRGVRDLQNHFNCRLFDFIKKLGKKVIAWDEVLHVHMPHCLVQNWRGATTRDRTLVSGLDSIVSAGFYLDLFYPADVHYAYDPEASQKNLIQQEDAIKSDLRMRHVAAGLEWTDQWREGCVDIDNTSGRLSPNVGSVLGGEACLWGELVDAETLRTRLWSRLPAVAERLWSASQHCNVDFFYERLPSLVELKELSWEFSQNRGLEKSGLRPEQIGLAKMFEPVKWYARLLGKDAIEGRFSGNKMPKSRPYDTRTPLDRVVDFLSPESLDARSLFKACSQEDLIHHAKYWQEQKAKNWPPDMTGAIEALNAVGKILETFSRGSLDKRSVRERLLKLYGPHGEYMLAPIPWIIRWIDSD